MSNRFRLDVPTMDLLADVAVKLRTCDVTLMLAQVHGAVRIVFRG